MSSALCLLQWHALSREEQAKYYELARKERQLHMQLYPGWSARDNYVGGWLSWQRLSMRVMGACSHRGNGDCQLESGYRAIYSAHCWDHYIWPFANLSSFVLAFTVALSVCSQSCVSWGDNPVFQCQGL